MSTSSTKEQQEIVGAPETKSSTSSIDDSPSSESPNLETSEAQGTSSSASSKEACSSSVESPNLETFEALGMSSSTSSKEACSSSIESPNLQETSDALGTSSSTSSKEACSSSIESPNLGFPETPEMPSSLSDKESSAAVDSTTGTSKDGDEIVIVSSKTASPSLMSTIHSSIHRVTQEIQCCCDPCIKCCNKCGALYNFFKCSKDAKCNCYKKSILILGALALFVSCLVLTPAVSPFWEMLYVSILSIFCSFLSACTVRGCFANPPPPMFPKRKRVSSPTEVAEKKSKKDTVPVTTQIDPPEDENNFVMNICEDPGVPESSGEGAVSG